MAAAVPDDVLDPAAMQALVELSNQSGGTLLNAMIDAFLTEERPTALAQLRQATAANDMPALAQAAHKLRGSLTTFGATRLAALCAQLESKAKAGALPEPAAALRQLESELATVSQALAACKSR
jgi:HPt (histidine-containing phosphotransfer) domain-containing protein